MVVRVISVFCKSSYLLTQHWKQELLFHSYVYKCTYYQYEMLSYISDFYSITLWVGWNSFSDFSKVVKVHMVLKQPCRNVLSHPVVKYIMSAMNYNCCPTRGQ